MSSFPTLFKYAHNTHTDENWVQQQQKWWATLRKDINFIVLGFFLWLHYIQHFIRFLFHDLDEFYNKIQKVYDSSDDPKERAHPHKYYIFMFSSRATRWYDFSVCS